VGVVTWGSGVVAGLLLWQPIKPKASAMTHIGSSRFIDNSPQIFNKSRSELASKNDTTTSILNQIQVVVERVFSSSWQQAIVGTLCLV
jgi:hypothetical protein